MKEKMIGMHMSCVFPINANQTVIVNGFLPRSRIFHSYSSWRRAVKKIPGYCSFRGAYEKTRMYYLCKGRMYYLCKGRMYYLCKGRMYYLCKGRNAPAHGYGS